MTKNVEDIVNNTTILELELTENIKNFINTVNGLEFQENSFEITITQKEDFKSIYLLKAAISEVLERTDRDGKHFLQVNLKTGDKLLVTDTLIGFKPFPVAKLDMNKIPKVVTTPDCISVFEAIEECLREEPMDFEELDTLKRVFTGIIKGAELIGFDMNEEKTWLKRLVLTTNEVA